MFCVERKGGGEARGGAADNLRRILSDPDHATKQIRVNHTQKNLEELLKKSHTFKLNTERTPNHNISEKFSDCLKYMQ